MKTLRLAIQHASTRLTPPPHLEVTRVTLYVVRLGIEPKTICFKPMTKDLSDFAKMPFFWNVCLGTDQPHNKTSRTASYRDSGCSQGGYGDPHPRPTPASPRTHWPKNILVYFVTE